MKWQPIESAPKGPTILAYVPRHGTAYTCHYSDGGWVMGCWNKEPIQPTHWKHVPRMPHQATFWERRPRLLRHLRLFTYAMSLGDIFWEVVADYKWWLTGDDGWQQWTPKRLADEMDKRIAENRRGPVEELPF